MSADGTKPKLKPVDFPGTKRKVILVASYSKDAKYAGSFLVTHFDCGGPYLQQVKIGVPR